MSNTESNSKVAKTKVIAPLRLLQDAIVYAEVTVIILLLFVYVQPYQRVFHCDDDSIRYPYMPDIVTNGALMSLSTAIPIMTVMLVETVRMRKKRRKLMVEAADDRNNVIIEIADTQPLPLASLTHPHPTTYYIGKQRVAPLVFHTGRQMSIFVIGFSMCVILTFVGKLTMGQLRPHFLDICKPNWNYTQCVSGPYFDGSVCQGTDAAMLKEARQSFPSGHASISAYSALYTILYLRKRASWPSSPNTGRLIMPVLQVILVSSALFTGVSRVADNHHHLIDVICGWFLGAGTAFMFCCHFGLVGK